MRKNLVGKTKECTYTEGNHLYKLVVEYGFNKFAEQYPYFSITGNLYIWDRSRWREYAGGCIHKEISQHMPELDELIKWHLCAINNGPMHYMANSMFWFERSMHQVLEPLYKGDTCAVGDKALEHFKSICVYGSAPSYDRIENTLLRDRKNDSFNHNLIRTWLKHRFNEMMLSFETVMKKHELL
jgi:hypothetical protein